MGYESYKAGLQEQNIKFLKERIDAQDAEIKRLRERLLSAQEVATNLKTDNNLLREALEFAFDNTATSFMGVSFSFDAVKKLRRAFGEVSNE